MNAKAHGPMARSVHDRLLNLAVSRKEDFNALLARYGNERILYRLTRTKHGGRFMSVLMGLATTPKSRSTSGDVREGFSMHDIKWLLDSDPAVRWQVMRDLADAAPEEVAAERARVAVEGVGARLLALQGPDGRWGGTAWNRGWDSTMHALMLLRDFGLDPASEAARRAVGLVRDRVTWRGFDPTRSSLPTYISRVIYRRCCTLLRDSRKPMRHLGSLGERAGDQLIRDERHRMTGYEPDRFRPTVEDKETAELVQQAVSQLPDNLKRVALLLMTHTQAEASRVLGVSESSIHRSRQKIRKRLARLGLRILCECAEDSAAFR